MTGGSRRQFRVEQENHLLRGLYRALFILVVAVALVLAAAVFLPQNAKLIELRRQSGVLDIKLKEQQVLLESRQKHIRLIENDPEYVEIVARDLIGDGLMKPGETIFRFTPAAGQ